jgi:hypothetical protein
MAEIVIKEVNDRRMRKHFIALTDHIYRHDPAWVPPLVWERKQFLSPQNPYFEHARFRSWIAFRNGNPVGRICAQVDELHLDRYQDDTGFYGMLEADNDGALFAALFETAEAWLRRQGMRRVRGPFNLSINHECGMLVEGFQTPPMIMMGHSRPYYEKRIKQQGYQNAIDLLAYRAPTDTQFTPAMQRIISQYAHAIHIRAFDFARLDEDLSIFKDVFEDAWSANWGFLPFTENELKHLGQDLKLFVPAELAAIAEIDGRPAAIMLIFPNLYEAIRDLNGRLLPLGWLKLLWRLKTTAIKTIRVPIMGVRQQYHNTRMGAALSLSLVAHLQTVALKRGYQEVELSWILESNKGMRNILESAGARAYKRYRIFSKHL